MIKNLIIGAGFSAAITKIVLGKESEIIGCLKQDKFHYNNLIRRKSLECNKIFSKKTLSYGSLRFNLKNGRLHDRLFKGGNSNIWGGKFNIKKIPNKFINLLKKNNIFLQKLSYSKTGTISNNSDLAQLQTMSQKIFKVEHLPIKIKNNYVLKIFKDKKKLNVLSVNNKTKKKKIKTNKIILCVGTVQLLDLLFRSGFIKDKDIIEFSEFKHEFKWNFLNAKFNKKTTTVRYHFSRALGHYLGIQYFSLLLKFFKIIPLCIDQIFYLKKNNFKLILKDGVISEIKKKNSYKENFGDSIHYCNMRINKLNINNFLKKFDKNLIGVGMPFVNQKIPGPISNEILLDMIKKIGFQD